MAAGLSAEALAVIVSAAVTAGGVAVTTRQRWQAKRKRSTDALAFFEGVPENKSLGQPAILPAAQRFAEVEDTQQEILATQGEMLGVLIQIAENTNVDASRLRARLRA